MRAGVVNVGLFLVAVAASAAIGEAALRAVVVMPLPWIEPEVRYSDHPVRRFTLRPNQDGFTYGAPFKVDAQGFRSNGTVRSTTTAPVLALGDSFTFGMGVRDEETWPARLEQGLRERLGKAVSVINAGTISYGVFQEFDYLNTAGPALKPKLVIHALYWNDFMSAEAPPPSAPSVVTPEGYFVWNQPPQRDSVTQLLGGALSHSALVFTLKQVTRQFFSSEASAYSRAYDQFLTRGLLPAEWQPIETFYRDLLSLGQSEGFATLVIVMPVNDLVTRGPAGHPYPVEARKILERLGIPYVMAFDLPLGAQHFLPQGPDSHLNAEGYRLVAAATTKHIVERADLAARLHSTR